MEQQSQKEEDGISVEDSAVGLLQQAARRVGVASSQTVLNPKQRQLHIAFHHLNCFLYGRCRYPVS